MSLSEVDHQVDFGYKPRDLAGERIAIGKMLVAAENKVDEYKAILATIDAQLLNQWMEDQTNHIAREGVTLYLHRGRYALPSVDDAALCTALEAAGLGGIVKTTVNRNTLTATLKELDGTSGIPEGLAAVVELKDKYSIRMRGAK